MFAIGVPTAIGEDASSMRWQVDQTVVSVGPYMFHRARTRGTSSAASAGRSASPPQSAVSDRSPIHPAAQSSCHVTGVACRMVALVLLEQADEQPRIVRLLLRRDDHGRPGAERREQLEHGDVERQRGDGAQRVLCAEPRPLEHALEEVADRAARHGHPLGSSRRAGGVDDVGRRVRRRDRGWRGRGGLPLRDVGLELDDVDAGAIEERAQSSRGHDVRQLRVLDHVLEALGRKRRIERHVGAAASQRRQHRDDHLRRAGQADAEEPTRLGAGGGDGAREALDLRDQRAVADLLARAAECEARAATFAVTREETVEVLSNEGRTQLGRDANSAQARRARRERVGIDRALRGSGARTLGRVALVFVAHGSTCPASASSAPAWRVHTPPVAAPAKARR